MKKCTKCKTYKPLTKFYRDCQKKSGYRPSCGECSEKQKREHHEKNPQVRVQRGKRYYANNRELVKGKVKAYAPDYLKKRRKSSPLHKCKSSVSTRIRGALAGRQSYTVDSDLYKIVGVPYLNLINHLHSTFEATYGLPRECINLADVEIDHIIPLSTAKTVEDVRRLNHYTNLQLLFKEDNQAKGTKLTLDLSPDLV